MEDKKLSSIKNQENKQNPLPEYVPPKIITYTQEQILEQVGPAEACSPGYNGCGMSGG